MNYYQYKRRAPRSKGADYIKPFLVIIIFIGIIVAAWHLFGSLFQNGNQPLSSEKVYLDIETGSAKAMTAADTEWKNVPSSIYLYEGESLKTQSDGRATLKFFERDTIRMDKGTEVKFAALQRDAAGNLASLDLNQGKLWVEIEGAGIDRSDFTLKTGLLTLRSTGGVFALSYPGMLYVIKGSVRADIIKDNKIIKSSTIGVGQELIVDEEIAANISEGLENEVIFALDDAFKSSDWYRWNQQQTSSVISEDEWVEDDETADETTATNDDEVVEIEEVKGEEEEQGDETVEESETTVPDQPLIEVPGSNGDTITLEDVEQIISGTVGKDTEAVMVNDYRLSQYKSGSGTFSYFAKVSFNNLKVGENEYEVIAVNKAGKKSTAATITLILPQSVYDESKDESDADTQDDVSAPAEASSNGGVSITSPNNGENLTTSETSFEIRGVVPSATNKVVVNDYTLQGFTAGNSTFMYRASSTLGTLKIGALNTYTAKAYNSDDELLGSATITIDVESVQTGSGDPVITMPSSESSYNTTLDQIVVGGSVGKWVEVVYLNGQKLNEYIPGSETWKKTVTLNPGENSFTVQGEKAGEETGTDTITIIYQN